VVLAAVVLAAVVPGSVSPAAAQQARLLSDDARISLLTILPGHRQVYEVFGHSAIRVYDPELGIDISYNYGTFDFGDSPFAELGFVARFAYGDLDYKLAAQDGERMIRWYWFERGRPLIEQTLDLKPLEREAIVAFLRNNARPENAYYRYDFFFDNCATRIVDVLEATVPGIGFDAQPPGPTLRRLLDPYLVERPLLHLGMDLGLGIPSDREATAREATFLPDYLADYLASGSVRREGESRPLVARTDTLFWSAEAAALTPALPWPTITLWLLLGALVWITLGDYQEGRRGRRVLDGTFYGLLGVAGLLVVFLWFVSLHRVTKGNINLAWALPTHLAVAWVFLRRKSYGWLRPYLAVTAALAGILLAGWRLWPQDLPTALLPLLLAVIVRSAGLALAPAPDDPC
jgi:hypothetical protein